MKQYNTAFWSALEKLVSESKIIIDRPKGSRHPKYQNYVYPVDYGYLEGTTSMDGGGIDVWIGTESDSIDAVICTVDLLKKDSEFNELPAKAGRLGYWLKAMIRLEASLKMPA